MTRPVIGISGGAQIINESYRVQAAGERNIAAIAHAAGGVPLIIPGMPDSVNVRDLINVLDGVLLTGGRANVHPEEFGRPHHEAHEPYDRERDGITLALVRAAMEVGMPVFGVCRGIQEINVALGGTLHPEIRDLPGKMNHRMPPGETNHEIVFRKRHTVKLRKGGWFEKVLKTSEIYTNSLHGQACIDLGDGLVTEGLSEDGVIEAISAPNARGLCIGVQWHAEYEAASDPVSAAIFGAFGDAARNWRLSRAA